MGCQFRIACLVITGMLFAMSEGTMTKDLTARQAIDTRIYKRSNNNNNNNNNNYNSNTNININYNWVTVTRVTTIATSTSIQCSLQNGKTLTFGQTSVAADGCTKITCSASGIISFSKSCPNHSPTQRDFHQCSYAGGTYLLGETFTHVDGCNQCVCGLTSVQCTDADACKPKADCTHNGVGYSSGQSFPHPDGCNMCQCTILGVMCTSNTCTTTTTTTTAAPFTCEWFGKFYHDGDVMQGDGCHTCTCNHGQAVCAASMNCPVSG